MTDGLALVGSIARVLNAGHRVEETLAAVLDRLRAGLGARAAILWHREPHASHFRRLASPPWFEGDGRAPDLRQELVHEGERVGALELVATGAGGFPAATRAGEIAAVTGEVLAPYLASVELSEDLAREVAKRGWEIETQRRLTELVIDSLPVGLYVVDRAYRIQVWNRKRETGTQGVPREYAVGRSVFEVLTRQSPERLREEFDRVFATGEIRQVVVEHRAGDDARYYRISKIPMRLDGREISHVITIGEDVTEARGAFQRMAQSEKLAALGQLAAGVMHEINNPLATIGACAEAMSRRLAESGNEPARAAVEEYLRIVESEVERCTRIVAGLLDFSRSKGRLARRVDLASLLEDTLFLLRHHPRFRDLEVGRELAPGLPPVQANVEQLKQVFVALLLNGRDAVEQGGTLAVRARVNPAAPGEVMVEVEDTGVGIPPTVLPRIFEPFFTTKEAGRGTGLGLSICYGIVQAHGGRIEVESQVGKGSLFRVILPAESSS
ncbi:MAG TPA: ATP-binding protein [Gemmatimonadales bacterium]|nr:ATP-binding protein [Gemmatimonadales bacterium]